MSKLLRETNALGFTNKNAALTNNELDNNFVEISADIDTKADIASPVLTGVPTAPTAPVATNTTQIATTAHVFAERTSTSTLTNKTLTGAVLNGTLGAITPSTVAATTITATGNVTGANLSGTNTGDNATNTLYSGLITNATHTGDVTGTTALTIANNSVNNIKLADVPTATLKGRVTAATGDPEDLTVVQARILLAVNNVDNTSDANKSVSTAQQTALGFKADLVGGKIPSAQLPAVAIGETFTVATQADMLALTAQIGDVAIRTDLANRKFLLLGTSTASGDWVALTASGLAVDSVNGYEGAVVLVKADVGLGNVDNTSDVAKPISTAAQTALNTKANLASPVLTGTPTAPTAAVATNTTQIATTAHVFAERAAAATLTNKTLTGAVLNGTLGATVPSSVAATTVTASGAITGLNLSGTNTGDQSTVTGNAGTATTLAVARTIGLSGVTATATSFNGGSNITIPVTAVPTTLLTGAVADANISGSYTGMVNLTGSGSVDFNKFLGLATDLVTTPSYTWTGDTTTGFYRPTTGQVGVAISGVQRALITSTGLTVNGAISANNLSLTNGQLSFPAVQVPSTNANTLDDYQEISFTFTATGMTTVPTGVANAVKIGNMVTINLPTISGISNSSGFTLTGLPANLRPSSQRSVMVIIRNTIGSYTEDNTGGFIPGLLLVESTGVCSIKQNLADGLFPITGAKTISASSISYVI